MVKRPARVQAAENWARRAASHEGLAWSRRLPIRPDTVLYESFSGNGALCNPEAIFRGLLAAPDMQHLNHIWAVNGEAGYESTIAEFADDRRVKFVRLGSNAYNRAMATAKYLVNNATFPHSFAKREGQIYLNTWHGTPLKAMGYDVPGEAVLTRNVARNFLACDYLLAPNDATASMYIDAYRMVNVFQGKLICEGTPRIDRQFASEKEKDDVRAQLRTAGVELPAGRPIVLYAPTWKGDFYGPTNDVKQLRHRVRQLRARLGDGYTVLLKIHQQVYQFAGRHKDLRPMLVPNELPTNAVLAVADVVVTDYSSLYTDFLATGRPVVFFAPDLEEYRATRGLNVPLDEWPGPITSDVESLATAIKAIGTGTADDPVVSHATQYAKAREQFCAKENGHATDRVIDIVFRGNAAGYDVRPGFSDGRETVLIYLGGVLPNGITASALSLLNSIDHTRFDVSVFYDHTTRRDRAALVAQIHPAVRLLPRSGPMVARKTQLRRLMASERDGRWQTHRSHAADLERFDQALAEEWTRCFGDGRFTYLVDFSGYSPLWDKVLLQGRKKFGPDVKLSVWMHNDLRSDAERQVDGRFLHRANLHGMFELYQFFDHLVSVSSALARINATALAEYADADKFTYARNTIDYKRVLSLGYGLDELEQAALRPGERPIASRVDELEPGLKVESFQPQDLRGSIDRLEAFHEIEDIAAEASRRAHVKQILPPEPGTRTFVTAGRLSPEKNHARLIKAFDIVHQEFPDTRLVILGNGPLKASLAQLITDLGLHASVSLAGHQANPYDVMGRSDCFVLSSDYEGQPMVLLEALVLGLPVITTSFASVADAFPDGCGLVVESDEKALAKGMIAFLTGDVDFKPFDYVAYNRDATDDFYRAIGAAPVNA